MGLLDTQRIVVTGGGSGIGAATCSRLAQEGARVGVLDIDADSARAVASTVDGVPLVADVSRGGALEEAIDRGVDELGGLTGLVNNAGVGSIAMLDGYDDQEWERLIGVNLRGVFRSTRAVAPLLRDAGGGSIVNVASVSGIRPTKGEAPYSAAKAGVIALTRSTAVEYAPTVRANCVSPGFVRTPLTEVVLGDDRLRASVESGTPLGRAGTAEEVADAIVFLLSDLARYITGQNLVVDGGSMLGNPQSDGVLDAMLELFAEGPS
jgi:NAD(P)-dependent dehydrogenase (short-subunit alcohol dehydrogenase family)